MYKEAVEVIVQSLETGEGDYKSKCQSKQHEKCTSQKNFQYTGDINIQNIKVSVTRHSHSLSDVSQCRNQKTTYGCSMLDLTDRKNNEEVLTDRCDPVDQRVFIDGYYENREVELFVRKVRVLAGDGNLIADNCMESNDDSNNAQIKEDMEMSTNQKKKDQNAKYNVVDSKSEHQKGEIKPSKNTQSINMNSRNLFKEAKVLENECNEITPQLTALENELKHSEERALYQTRTLKMNLLKSEQEYNKALEANVEAKKRFSELHYHLLRLDLESAVEEKIHQKNMSALSFEMSKTRAKLLELGRTINGLWENTKKLADVILPKEKPETYIKFPSISWMFRSKTETLKKDVTSND